MNLLMVGTSFKTAPIDVRVLGPKGDDDYALATKLVHDIKRVELERAQVGMDLRTQVSGRPRVYPAAGLVAHRADLRDDVHVVGVRRERLMDDLVGDVGAVEVGRVDVRNAQR